MLMIVCLMTIGVTLFMALATRGIPFINVSPSPNGGMTDAEKQVVAASYSSKWRWPSDMHKHAGEKARMKDVGVLGVALFQRVFGDKTSAYPIVFLCNVSAGVSAILLYLVASSYWNPAIGFLSFVLFITCFWPHQITLTGGYHTLAQSLLLLGIFFLQVFESSSSFGFLCLLSSGFVLGLMMFASASGRKFLPLYFGAFLFSQRLLIQPSFNSTIPVLAWISLWVVSSGVFYLLYDAMITSIYKGGRFESLLASRDKHPLSRYLGWKKKMTRLFASLSGAVVFYISAMLILSSDSRFYFNQFMVWCGFSLAVVWLIIPNVLQNVRGYLSYWYLPKNSCHFRLYADFFKGLGMTVKEGMRGAGWKWIFLFFGKVLPFYSLLYVAAFLLSGAALFAAGFSSENFAKWGAVLFLSLSPILYGEVTKSPQFARPYFPALLGILLGIAWGFFQVEQVLSARESEIFWSAVVVVTLCNFGFNLWIFLNDVLPCRMASVKLSKVLDKISGQKMYTYDTPYNDAFVHALPLLKKEGFHIEFIRSLKEVQSGFVIVPGTSSKSLNIESYQEGIQNIDFDADSQLSELIRSKKIEQCAVASFKTYGSSRIWVHDSEMPTYRELILKDITPDDRWRGMAWVLDVRCLQREQFSC
ncbi:MAG: hypothetical protein Q7T03_04775 [Deltaproteobacteria bacterium]|nr:hypothetical protein [Deltaproteobacteria bacterium]